MNKKIFTILIVIGILFCFSSVVSADNNTTENTEEIDLSHYITVASVNGNEVTFSDGYSGFLIEGEKNVASSNDGFTQKSTSGIDIANYLKLAIIECYKQNSESNIGSTIDKFVEGSYKSSNDDIVKNVMESNENIGDHEVVQINNNTEATFDFEVLEPVNDSTSKYIAYTVSLQTVEVEDNSSDDTLKANDDNQTDDEPSNDSNKTDSNNDKNTKTDDKNINENKDKNTKTDEKNVSKNKDKNTKTDNKDSKEKASEKAPNENNTEVHVKNKTIVNKTNTLIVNEKNTTIINKTTVKHINNTTNATPQNNLMKVAGNPITILIIVVAILAIAGVVYNRRG